MKFWKSVAAGAAVALMLAIAGCTHKLVTAPGQTSVPLYQDEDTFTKLSQLKQQGGMQGMIGSLGQTFAAKQIDNQTPVKVLSKDNNGAEVEITSGPMKGQTGFVAKQNLN